MRRTVKLLAAMAALAVLAACNNDSGSYIEVVGGGFIFNYRLADVTAGLVVVPDRALPDGSSVEVSFENPAGGAPIVIKKDSSNRKTQMDFTTPDLTNVVARQGLRRQHPAAGPRTARSSSASTRRSARSSTSRSCRRSR